MSPQHDPALSANPVWIFFVISQYCIYVIFPNHKKIMLPFIGLANLEMLLTFNINKKKQPMIYHESYLTFKNHNMSLVVFDLFMFNVINILKLVTSIIEANANLISRIASMTTNLVTPNFGIPKINTFLK